MLSLPTQEADQLDLPACRDQPPGVVEQLALDAAQTKARTQDQQARHGRAR